MDTSAISLQTLVMKSMLSLWQKPAVAEPPTMVRLAKAKQFWETVNKPLLKFLDTESPDVKATSHSSRLVMTDKLTSYVLMILARELFYLNSGASKRKMNPSLKEAFNKMSEKNMLGKYSQFVSNTRQQVSSGLYKRDNFNQILFAWRDFLSSCAKFEPLEVSTDVKNQIVVDLMGCMSAELRLAEQLDKERLAATGDTFLLIWTRGMGHDITDEELFNSFRELLYLTNTSKDYLPFSFLLTFQSALNLYLVRRVDYLKTNKHSFDLLSPALQLMHFSLNVMVKYLNEQRAMNNVVSDVKSNYKSGIELRLSLVSITTLRLIIEVSKDEHNLWLSYIETNLKADSLLRLLTLLMNKRSCSDICLSIVDLLLCLSSISTHIAIEFLSIYCIRICELLELLRTKPRSIVKGEQLQMIHMIDLFQHYGRMWKKRNKQSYEAIVEELSETARTLSNSALPPPTTTTGGPQTVAGNGEVSAEAGAPSGGQLSDQETDERIFWILMRRIIHLDKSELK